MNKIIQLIDRGDKGIDIDKSLNSSSKKSKSISRTNPKLFKDAAAYTKHLKIRELLAIESKPTEVKIEDNYMYTLRKKHYNRGHSLIIPGMDPEIHPKGSAPIIIKLRALSPATPSRTSLLSPATNLFHDDNFENRLESPSKGSRQSGPGWISRPTSEMTQNSGRIAKPVVIFRPPLRFITYANTQDKVSPTMKAKTIGSININSPIKKEDVGVTTLKEFYLDPYAKNAKLPKAGKHEIIFNRDPGPCLSIDYEPNSRKKRPICRQNWT